MNKMMTWISQTILMFSFLIIPLNITSATAPAGFPGFNNPDFQAQLDREMAEFKQKTPAQQEAILQQEMQTLMEDETFKETLKKIEDFSQTPEGKALFEKIEKEGDISDEDLNKLMNYVEAPESAQPAPIIEEPKIELPKPEPKPVITSEDQKAIAMLTDLITNTASFIVKAGQVTDIANKVKRWEKKYPSFKWKKGNPWNTFTTDLDKFVSQLKMLLEKDPKDQSYLHIKTLIADKSLYNNLSKTSQAMAKHEPAIEDITPSVKLSAKSKKALMSAISEYHEALYIMNAPQEINAVMNKFEPTAKKLTDKEAAAAKKAEEESKRARTRGRITTAGQADDDAYYAPMSYDDRSSYSQPYTPSYSSPSYEPYNYGGSNTPSADTKKPSTGGSGGGFNLGSGKKDAKDDKEKPEEKELSEGEKLAKAMKAADDLKKHGKNPEVDELMKDITKNVEAAAKSLTSSNALKNFKAHLIDSAQPTDKDFDQIMTEVKSELSSRKGAIDKIKTLRSKKLNPVMVQAQQDKLNQLYGKHKIFDQLIGEIEGVIAEFETLKTAITPDKLNTYIHRISDDNKKEAEKIKIRAEQIDALATSEGRAVTDAEKQEIADAVIAIEATVERPIIDLLTLLKEFKDTITNAAKAPAPKPAAAVTH